MQMDDLHREMELRAGLDSTVWSYLAYDSIRQLSTLSGLRTSMGKKNSQAKEKTPAEAPEPAEPAVPAPEPKLPIQVVYCSGALDMSTQIILHHR